MNRRLLLLSALVSACGSDGSSTIEPGDDLSGPWLGCADESCSEATLAGFLFTLGGRIRLIRGFENEDGEVERCVSDHPIFEDAKWQWGENDLPELVDIIGIGDLELAIDGRRLEVPVHESEPGYLFVHPGEYPDAEWMKRTRNDIPECDFFTASAQ